MAVEKPMSFAKDIQSGFSVFGPAEAVLRALAVARKEPFAFEAFLRKPVALAYAEADLLRRGHQFLQRSLKAHCMPGTRHLPFPLGFHSM